VAVGDDRRPVDGRQPGNAFDRATERILPQPIAVDVLLQHQIGKHG
jgi:hypothetical protein